ncbi:hypothetical protein [Oceanobacillus manasiensis]|uniref:hypothetical protein n=1 Tax=Oceanobacillus manasiensis TaxID=586413 RepID=UPI0005A72244|nr:hypothetical protein [Oceanobacillus manasiensis]
MVIIEEPYIKRNGEYSRLCADVFIDNKKYEMFYEVENEYEKYLCTERIDAFLIGLLPYALKHNLDIYSKYEVSEKLYYQIKTILIPVLSRYISNYNTVNVEAKVSYKKLPNKGAVGTGFSAGVDSFHTLYNNTNLEISSYNITHLTFFNVGSHGSKGGSEARSLYRNRMKKAKIFAEEQEFKFVSVDSNLSEILRLEFVQTHTFRSLSAVLALQKLFGVYYYSSGFPIDQFSIKEDSTAYYDLLNVYSLSNNNVSFYSTGLIESRLEKVKQISEYKKSYKYLNVCAKGDYNCGKCEKCKRTILEFYSINKLQLYSDVFDVDLFNKKIEKYLGFMIANKKNENYKEIYIELKERHIEVPLKAYFYGMRYFALKKLKLLLRNKKFSRYVYDKYLRKQFKTDA